jgi:beta-glucuronidase
MTVCLFVFLSVLFARSDAYTADLITNIAGRTTINLNSRWSAIVDPFDTGYFDYRYQPLREGFFTNRKPKSKTELIEYDFDTAELLSVPGDWNTQKEKLLFYEGTIWYKKSFDYTKKNGVRLFVYFGAANYWTIVYLNGEKIGEHEGGFTPFNFEITDKVREKDNFLIVKVDNRRRKDGVPTVNTDWWNYGGITRDVHLVEVPQTFILDYLVQLKKGSHSFIAGWVQLNGPDARQRLSLEIPELKITKELTTDEQGRAEINIEAHPQLWEPNSPKLYEIILRSEADVVRDFIGFRSIRTQGADILLNGKPIFLRGICIHEEAPFRSGRAFSEADAQVLLSWARELGCNFVRLAHYPHNEYMTRMADRMGLLVWSEIPVYWSIQFENPQTLANAGNQLREMIVRDRNKASVIIWSLANETPVTESRLAFLKSLAQQARQLDPTRLISAAMEKHSEKGSMVQMISDPFGEFVDVLGCNEYLGWYDGLPEKCDRVEWKSAYDKPLIMSEFGGDAVAGLHGDELTRWSEEYQESIYRHQIPMLKRISVLRGTSPWILMDFRSPRRTLPNIQDYWNRKGLISNRGEKKKAFYILKEYYQELLRNGR